MSRETCPLCSALVDEQAVLCPNCGRALIPQKTKTELSHEAADAGSGSRKVMWVIAAGFVAAYGSVIAWRLTQPGAEFWSAGFLLVSAFALGALVPGALLAWWLYRGRSRPRRSVSRPAEMEVDERPPTADEQAQVVREMQRGKEREWDGGDEGLRVN